MHYKAYIRKMSYKIDKAEKPMWCIADYKP